MSATSQPGVRTAKLSDKLHDSASKGAHESPGVARGAPAPLAAATLDQKRGREGVLAGEISTKSRSGARPFDERPTVPIVPTVIDAERWKPYEEIGLLPKPATHAAQRIVVSAYRMLGLAILTLVVFVLVGYIAVSTFYFLNKSWIAPVAISPNDEQVIALQSQLAAQLNDRAELVGELEQAERAIAAEQSFQLQFVKAIKKDLRGRKVALGRARQLSQAAAATRNEIRATNGDYSESTFSRMEDDYAAGMIDREAMLAGKFQLAQISTANLTLAERQADFDQRAAELAVQTESLDALLENEATTAALSYDILMIARDYEASKLVLAREMSNRERLQASIERQDKIIAGIQQSAYLRALADNATVALVPYSNLSNVSRGTPLYGCALDMVFCHRVGTVLEVLPGEIQVTHPTRDLVLRGRMIAMQMTEPTAAQDMVLFAGGPPLGF